MREKFFYWVMYHAKIEEGEKLPTWAKWLHMILWPGMAICRQFKFDYESDSWVIDGVPISRRFILRLKHSDGEVWRITKSPSGSITYEQVFLDGK